MLISKRNIAYLSENNKNFIIKEAASKQQVRDAFISKYTDKNIDKKKIISFADQYREKRKSEPGFQDLQYDDLYSQLPASIEEVIYFLRNTNKDEINKLKELGLDVDENTNNDIVKYLTSRYIYNTKNEIHPADEALDALKLYFRYIEKTNVFYDGDSDFSNFLKEKSILDINDIQNLTVDDILIITNITAKREEGASLKQTSVDTTNIKIKEEEKIHTFKVDDDTWNLWLPLSQETSAKIAGYDPITKEPQTQWCTARTFGSNLFYKYTLTGGYGRELYLFYIIKENPKNDDDWLSIAFINNNRDGEFDFRGFNGGPSVNRANKGLKREDYERILKSSFGSLLDIIRNKVKSFNNINPVKKEFINLTDDIKNFKKSFYTKSLIEKKDFCIDTIRIRGDDDIESVKICFDFLAKNNPIEFMEECTIGFGTKEIKSKYNKTSEYINIAIDSIARNKPEFFINKIYGTLIDNEVYNDQQTKDVSSLSIIKSNPILFLVSYSKDETNENIIKKCIDEIKNFAVNSPEKFIYEAVEVLYVNKEETNSILKPEEIEKLLISFCFHAIDEFKNKNIYQFISFILYNKKTISLLVKNEQKIIENISNAIEDYIKIPDAEINIYSKIRDLKKIDSIYFSNINNLDSFFNNIIDNSTAEFDYNKLLELINIIEYKCEKNNVISNNTIEKLNKKIITTNPISYLQGNSIGITEDGIKIAIESIFNVDGFSSSYKLIFLLLKIIDALDDINSDESIVLEYIYNNYQKKYEDAISESPVFFLTNISINIAKIKKYNSVKKFLVKCFKNSFDSLPDSGYNKNSCIHLIKNDQNLYDIFGEVIDDKNITKNTSTKNNKLLKLSRSLYKLGFVKESLQLLKI